MNASAPRPSAPSAICYLLLAIASLSCHARATPQKDAWTLNLYVENDVIAGTDRNYTNGAKISWISPDVTRFKDIKKAAWLDFVVKNLPYINDEGLQRNVVLSLGQNMYTPQEIWRDDLITDDRPYGGWLYLGFGFHSKNERSLDSWEINLGAVGKWSGAADTQKIVHELIDSPRPRGWHNQIGDEPGLNFVYLHKKRVAFDGRRDSWAWEAFYHYGGSLGNVATYLNSGLEARVGWKLPSDFGSALIRMGDNGSAPTADDDPRFQEGWNSLGFALHSSLDARYVARDIFLDGNTFKDSIHTVDKIPWVGEASLGATLSAGRWKFSYTQVFRSRQYTLQDKAHTFGSLNLSVVY